MALRTRTPRARALLPATRCQSSGPLGALLSSPALDVRLMTALQVLQVSIPAPIPQINPQEGTAMHYSVCSEIKNSFFSLTRFAVLSVLELDSVCV